MRYVLENTLLFDDQEGTLTAMASGESAKLPYAAVLLLKVFCENPRVLLGRNDLMDRAWTENGLRASGSNLYNSLSLIRRTVETLDVDLHIIRTQPKIGLIMEVTVERQEERGKQSPEMSSINDSPLQAELPSESVPSSSDRALEPAEALISLSEHPAMTRVAESPSASKQGLSRLLPPASYFYLFWTVLMLVVLTGFQLYKAHHVDKSELLHESYDKMGALQQCNLFRLDETSDVYPGESVASKITQLANKYKINCRDHRADFYVYSNSNRHNSYNSTSQLNIVCVSNKTNNTAIDCLNDVVQTRRP